MIGLGTFQFLTPSWLLLLPPMWLLLWRLARARLQQSMWSQVCDTHLLQKMQPDNAASNGLRWLIWPLAIILTLAVLAAAGPSWRQQTHPLTESASARIIALDLSSAMRVQDVKPSRFAQALAAAREMIQSDFDGETGLLVFSGAAFVVSPLSRDASTLSAFVDALEPGILPLDGARVDLAIARAQDLLLASISGKGQIIVITSGIDRYADALQAAASARQLGHRVSIMAIGTVAGGPLIDEDGTLAKDGQGNFVLAKTDFSALQDIAAAGDGFMVSLDQATDYSELLGSRIRANNLVEASHESANENREAANDGIWLVWMILPIALLLFRKNLLWIILLAVMLPLDENAYAADQDTIWQHRERRAFEAYRQGNFGRSAELSRNALLKGSSHYRNGGYRQAIEYFSLDDSASAHYNRGNSLARLKRMSEAIAAYGEALARAPELTAARYNKRLLELFLARQQEIDGNQSADADDNEGDAVLPEQAAGDNRPGVIGQEFTNPADEQRQQPGLGASQQSGMLDPFEQFDGLEQQLERLALGEGIDRAQAEILMDNWIKNLPAASSDLFRRKFSRDYQRQRQQQR